MHRLGICSRAVKGLVADVLVPGLMGAAVLIVVDIARGESAPWWLVALIFVLVFALYEGARHTGGRRRR
jgi:hypothetical protein